MIEVGSLVSFKNKKLEKTWMGVVVDISKHPTGTNVIVHWSAGYIWSHKIEALTLT